MKPTRITGLHAGFLLLLLSWPAAHAAVKTGIIHVKVLDSETHSVVLDDSGVPKNCDATNYDAYCHSSKEASVTNILLVQEEGQPPFRISCTGDTKYSRCVPLETGATLEARREKNGLLVYYVDEQGKVRRQLYRMVQTSPGDASGTGMLASAPTQGEVPIKPGPRASTPQETVKCSFSSTPSGAELTIDGRYAGNTPSVIGLTVGPHTVEISLSGFEKWKRDLTVSPGSELTVSAVLEKVQQERAKGGTSLPPRS